MVAGGFVLVSVAMGTLAGEGARVGLLFLLLAYGIVSSAALTPIPHEPGLVYFGGYFSPLVVAGVASLGAAVAALLEYPWLRWLVRRARAGGASLLRAPGRLRQGQEFPFVWVVATGFLPVPSAPFRLLAIGSGQSRRKYVSGVLLGRTPRYYLLACLGNLLASSGRLLVGMGMAVLGWSVFWLSRRFRSDLRPISENATE